MMVRMMFGAVLMLAATPAMATDWTAITLTDTKIGVSAVFADRDSLQALDGDLVRVQVAYVLEKDRGGVAAFVTEYDIDCKGNRYRRAWMRTYSAESKMLGEEATNDDWIQAEEGQTTGAINRFICQGTISQPGTPGLGAALPIEYGRQQIRDNPK